MNDMLEGSNERDFVRIVFNSPQLDKPVSMPVVRCDQLDNNAFSTKLETVLQPHEEVSLDENVSFNIIHLQMPEGGKNSKRIIMADFFHTPLRLFHNDIKVSHCRWYKIMCLLHSAFIF